MGRWVLTLLGNVEFKSKFPFATQCSNFGVVLENHLEQTEEGVYVDRYEGVKGNGEVVNIMGSRDRILEILKKVITEMEVMAVKGERCELCGSQECFMHTIEMVKEFKEAVERCKDEEVNVWLFVEYQ